MRPSPDDYRNYCLRSFTFFARMMQDDRGEHFHPVHKELCEFLQWQYDNRNPVRAKVIMPRTSLKTTFATKLFSIWLALRNPEERILIAMATEKNARSKLRGIRKEFELSPVIRGFFPHVIPDKGVALWSDSQVELKRARAYEEATFEAVGVRTTAISRHYTWIIEDDTVAPGLDELGREFVLPTQEDIDQAIGWHRLATPLMVDSMHGGRLVVGTRWAYDDLLAWIEKNEPSYDTFDRPATYEGVPIMPKFAEHALQDIKRSLGTYMYSSLYQNKPLRPEDMLFRPEWFTFYDEGKELSNWYITCDPAISQKREACETVVMRCSHDRPNIYVERTAHGRFTPQVTIQTIAEMVEIDPGHTRAVGVEAVAYQAALAMLLQDEFRRRHWAVPVIPIHTTTAKDERIRALQPLMERGQLQFARKGCDWLHDQLVQFPHGRLRDGPDCLSMQLKWYRGLKRIGEPEPVLVRSELPTMGDVLKLAHAPVEASVLTTGLGSDRVNENVLDTGLPSE